MKESKKFELKGVVIAIVVTLIAYFFISGTKYDYPGQLSEQFLGDQLYGWLIVFALISTGVTENLRKDAVFDKTLNLAEKGTDVSTADELKKWVELRDTGVITEEEFQNKKKELIAPSKSKWG